MLQAVERGRVSEKTRPLEAAAEATSGCSSICMVVADGTGQELGEHTVPTPDSSGPWRVRIELSSAQGVSAAAMSDGSGSTRQTAAQGSGHQGLDIAVIPPVTQQLYELLKEGIV